jgi:membrane protease YdiL (CAAX protease family)
VQLIGAGITVLLGGEVTSPLDEHSVSGLAALIILSFLYGALVSGGVNEETGWRGFVLPRLQRKYPVLVAIIIVWFFWALWHIPYDIGTGTPLSAILLNRILFNFIWTVLMVWLYNRTRGSLLAPVLFHPAMNTFGDLLPRTDITTWMFALMVVVLVIHERMWVRLPDDHPAVYRPSLP